MINADAFGVFQGCSGRGMPLKAGHTYNFRKPLHESRAAFAVSLVRAFYGQNMTNYSAARTSHDFVDAPQQTGTHNHRNQTI